ncbi:putative Protein elav [Paratrimastix pyriformis]|uniref:RRM domain-containing protein n=1 Tax=Paratrimastix pyriformis TaxID=342808 RepID=A0ABQ8UH71_9EUKA|nr:putative Protein elav [Paratrimastix pyriformis]
MEQPMLLANVNPLQSRIIVNYLPPSVFEATLRDLFAPFGTITSCKLMVDRRFGTSLGYGFIEYSKPEEATRAIEQMNGRPIESKRLKVSLARPPSTVIQNANLYISNLGPTVSPQMLGSVFGHFGKIIDVKVLTDGNTGLGRGVGFVRFNTHLEALNAISALNGTMPFPGMQSPLGVKLAENLRQKQARGIPFFPPPAATFIPQLPTQPVAAFPPVAAVAQIPAQIPIMHPAFAHVGAQPAEFSLFVYNLPQECDEGTLYRLFAPYGAITSVKVVKDPHTGASRGYGFVVMQRFQEAQQAILNLNGFAVQGKPLQVSFKTDKANAAKPHAASPPGVGASA